MRIGIDARLYGPRSGGIGRYLQMLLTALEKIDAQNQYVIFLRADNFKDYQPKAKNFNKVLADFRPYSWQEQILLPKVFKKEACDLYHFPHWNMPWLASRPAIVTIHDLILTHYPDARASTLPAWLYQLKLWFYNFSIKHTLRRANFIIAVSEFTRQDILNTFKIAKEKIKTIYEGVTQFTTRNKTLENNNLGTYFLYVGSAYPHKNLEFLLKSFKLYKERYLGLEKLVLVGQMDFFKTRLKKWAEENDLFEDVIFLERISDQELGSWYAQAKAYVFPSLYEGFGLPPLEAMNYGVPVLASKASCLPEILGEAALYFDPENLESLVEALRKISQDENLKQNLIQKGLAQIGKYQWEKTARETLNLYITAVDAQKEKNIKKIRSIGGKKDSTESCCDRKQ